jgi:hypothetical protein
MGGINIDRQYLIFEGSLADPVEYGMSRLRKTLKKLQPQMKIRLGVYTQSNVIRQLMQAAGVQPEHRAEAYAFVKYDGEALLSGYDSRGLMYGCFELCERLEQEKSLENIGSFCGAPFTKIRGIYSFLHNRQLEKEWFYSKEYWIDYFDMLAYNRFNSFNLVFSHQTHYMTPMFAYFLDIEQHPEVVPDDITNEERRRNYEMLQFISGAAECRGIDFIIGIWQVRAWKGGENDWRPSQQNHVKGLNDGNLESYTYLSLKKLFDEFPHIKGIQIRANEESGIAREYQTDFFTRTFFKTINESKRPILLDFRCWCAEAQTVENAMNMCPDIRLSVKYWAEFMGQPYQPGKISPGYSYANYLKQPIPYELVYQMWSLGSPRLLLWGDPEYVSRFVNSLRLGGGSGFEINPHLAQKGFGDEPGCWRIFKNIYNEYFDFEYKRYWLFFELFGRLSYDPEIRTGKWTDEIKRRLLLDDKHAENMLNAYKFSSRVLPFLVQYTLYDPNMNIWPEIDTGGLLDLYLQTPTSDKCVIYPISQYVSDYLRAQPGGRLTPQEASRYLKELSEAVFSNVAPLERWLDEGEGKELKASLIDFRVLGFLALYHSNKILAATHLELFYQTRDVSALYECYELIRTCTSCWEQLVSVTRPFYYDKMVTGPTDTGCWETKLKLVYEDELRISELLNIFNKYGNFYKGFDFGNESKIEVRDFYKFPIFKEYSTEKGFTCVSSAKAYENEDDFGFADTREIKSVMAQPVRLSDKHIDFKRRGANFETIAQDSFKGYRNMLYEDYIYSEKPAVFIASIENGKYEVTAVMCDRSSKAKKHGPMSISINEKRLSGITVYPMEEVSRTVDINVTNGRLTLELDCEKGTDWFLSAIIIKKKEPIVKTVPVYRYIPGESTVITATVTCPAPIASVSLNLKANNGKVIRKPMTLKNNSVYCADINGMIDDDSYGYEYSVSALSEEGFTGTSAQIPIQALVKSEGILVEHTPVRECNKGMDVKLVFKASSGAGITGARLFYSYINQYEELHSVDMNFENGLFSASIPKEYVDPAWQLMYYAQFTDGNMQGVVYPDFRCETPYYVISVR